MEKQEKKEKKETKEERIPGVLYPEDTLGAMPVTDAECPKCHNKKAYYWTAQTRAADEPETKFLKCQKCGHTWRDYS